MTLSAPSNTTEFEERQFEAQPSLFPTTTLEQEGSVAQNGRLRLDATIDIRNWFFPEDRMLESKDYLDKIEPIGFSYNNPWLPPNALKLLNKLKGPVTEKELITLMKLVAERATDHFQLEEGKFVAMTFYGRIVEVSDTRVGVLKKIQGRKYKEQVFLWRIGSNAFSGRI